MKNKTGQIFTRVTPEDRELIEKISNARGEQLSDFVRRAVRRELSRMGYLSKEEMKALEVL